MAELKSTIVHGNLRVTDAIYGDIDASNITSGKISNDRLNTGTTSGTIALGNHTHALGIAVNSTTDGDNNPAITLAHGTKYTLTAGGSTYIFKMPSGISQDTKNTAGSSDSNSKLYLIGASTQDVNGVITYSNSNIYMEAGTLYLIRTQDLSGTADNKPAIIIGGAASSTHLEIDADEIHAKTNGTSAANLYINNDGGKVYLGSGTSDSTPKRAYAENGVLYSKDTEVSIEGHTHSSYVNQNAYGKISNSTTTTTADATQDTITFAINTTTTASIGISGDTITINQTDTKNTVGSANSASKLYLVGAASQDSNGVISYSNSNVYATNGTLNATKYTVAATATIQYNSTTGCMEIIC